MRQKERPGKKKASKQERKKGEARRKYEGRGRESKRVKVSEAD